MASKKDMRRADLVIPFVEPDSDSSPPMSSTIGQTLPMAAMFTRQKMIGWVSLVFSVQNWLAETPEQVKRSGSPGYYSVGISAMAVVVCYLPMFLRPPGTATGPQLPVPVPPPQ